MRKAPGAISSVTIEGQQLTATFDRVRLDEVRLDPANPRIRHALKAKRLASPTQDDLRKVIWAEDLDELFKSIRDNAGLIDPIFIVEDGTVVEGNCRAAVYFRLRETFKDQPEWKHIPAWRLPNGTTKRQIAVFQAIHHVSGKRPWRLQERAGHLHQMRESLGMDAKSISKATGMQVKVVERLLATFETMTTEIIPKVPGSKGLAKFSYVEEFFKNKELEEFRSKPANVKAFVKLVVEERFGRGEDVRDLPKILENAKALSLLKTKNHAEAMRVVGKHDPTADSTVFKKLQDVTRTLQRLPATELERLRKEAQARKLLRELFAALKSAAAAAGVELS